MYNNYLIHHGIKGQRWGIRRYQNADGSLTIDGRDRYKYAKRARKAAETKSDMDKLYNKLSKEDKKILGDDENNKEWLKIEEGEYVAKRIIKKIGNEPIAAIDIMTTSKNDHLMTAIMTDPKYRGQGYAYELAKAGADWFDRNKHKMNATYLDWGAYQTNIPSKKLAEKAGFKYDEKASSKDWAIYRRS